MAGTVVSEIVRQGLVRVACSGPTNQGHARRTLGDLLVYLYDDDTASAVFRSERLPRGRHGIYIGPKMSRRAEQFRCEQCGIQRRIRQDRLDEVGKHLLLSGGLLEIRDLPA